MVSGCGSAAGCYKSQDRVLLIQRALGSHRVGESCPEGTERGRFPSDASPSQAQAPALPCLRRGEPGVKKCGFARGCSYRQIAAPGRQEGVGPYEAAGLPARRRRDPSSAKQSLERRALPARRDAPQDDREGAMLRGRSGGLIAPALRDSEHKKSLIGSVLDRIRDLFLLGSCFTSARRAW